MKSADWNVRCMELLSQRRERALLRERHPVHIIDATHVQMKGRQYVNFSSNNYLAFTHHFQLIRAVKTTVEAQGVGSGAAGLITGFTDAHARCEATLARWKGSESAILLPSGYQANLAAVQTAAALGEGKAGVRFLIDKLAHASLIDAARATEMPIRIFPHNHLTKLRRLLSEADSDQLQVVLTESIFSMDGDAADLAGIAELKQSHRFMLMLDEAHGSGVYGPGGRGYAAEIGLQNIVDVSIVTLSKALGCIGGAVCCSTLFRDALLNFGRAYIYSTSVPPFVAACVEAAIQVMHEEPQRQQRVRELARNVRQQLSSSGIKIPPGDSPIIPILFDSEQAALNAAEQLKSRGLLTVAVRPPTVPPGSSRLRVTLSCMHTDEEIAQLLKAIKETAKPK
jgi:8-amino-7-oxononanoate synthase